MRLVLLLPVIGLGAAGASAKTLEGKVDVTLAGDPVGCVAAKLLPRTPATERAVMAEFGTLEPAARPIAAEVLAAETSRGLESGSREARCYDWRGYGHLVSFRFKNVAPGDYFVTLLSRRSDRVSANLTQRDKPLAIYLMQPVRVAASGAIVRFSYQQK
jgi:hypothetical protein